MLSTALGPATLASGIEEFVAAVRLNGHLAVVSMLNISRTACLVLCGHAPAPPTPHGSHGLAVVSPIFGSGAGHLLAMTEGSSQKGHFVVKIISNNRLQPPATATLSLSRGRGHVGAASLEV